MPTLRWRHYGDPRVAPLCRPRNGSILVIRDTYSSIMRNGSIADLLNPYFW